jgi:hypothetical protein
MAKRSSPSGLAVLLLTDIKRPKEQSDRRLFVPGIWPEGCVHVTVWPAPTSYE